MLFRSLHTPVFTPASLILCENAAPAVRQDLETILARLAPDADPAYVHDDEGADDMAAHARSVLTTNSLQIPVADGKLALGTWQGIYLWRSKDDAERFYTPEWIAMVTRRWNAPPLRQQWMTPMVDESAEQRLVKAA